MDNNALWIALFGILVTNFFGFLGLLATQRSDRIKADTLWQRDKEERDAKAQELQEAVVHQANQVKLDSQDRSAAMLGKIANVAGAVGRLQADVSVNTAITKEANGFNAKIADLQQRNLALVSRLAEVIAPDTLAVVKDVVQDNNRTIHQVADAIASDPAKEPRK